VKTYPLFTILEFCHAAAGYVFAQHKPQEGRQGAPLLQHRGKSPAAEGKSVQRTVLYLGEINDQQQAAWRKRLEVFDEQERRYTTMSLFPEDREIPADALDSVQVRLSGLELRRPRMFGNCWLACELWHQLGLVSFSGNGSRKVGRE
jgi:hypothetical protein